MVFYTVDFSTIFDDQKARLKGASRDSKARVATQRRESRLKGATQQKGATQEKI